jgi:hypothetical protein
LPALNGSPIQDSTSAQGRLTNDTVTDESVWAVRTVMRWGESLTTVEGHVEGEDPAVGGDGPVPAALGIGGDADDRFVQRQVAGRAVEPGVAVGEGAAVAG